MILPGIKQELEELLHDKFLEVKEEMDERHKQNRAELERLNRALEDSTADRKRLHQQLVEVIADLAYLRGKSSGTFKRPPHP